MYLHLLVRIKERLVGATYLTFALILRIRLSFFFCSTVHLQNIKQNVVLTIFQFIDLVTIRELKGGIY